LEARNKTAEAGPPSAAIARGEDTMSGTRSVRFLWRPATVLAAIITAATVYGGASATARAAERSWTVKEIVGTARIQHGGTAPIALKIGDRIDPGSRVETAAGARLALVRPGDSLEVTANSRFEIPASVDPKDKAPAHILQTLGTLLFKITTRPHAPFSVKTPYLAAVIKGTVFTVMVKGSESELHVTKGAVEVTSVLTNKVVMVRPGMTAAINGAKGGEMQVIGPRRSDSGKSGSNVSSPAGGKIKAASESAGTRVIPRTVGVQRVDVFKSSGGLVRDLQKGPSNGHGPNAIGGRPSVSDTIGSSHDSAGSSGLAELNGRDHGLGNGLVKSLAAAEGPGDGPGNGVGKANGLGNGVANGLGNGVGNGIGNSVGNGIGNGVGNGVGNGIGNGVANGLSNGVGNGLGGGAALGAPGNSAPGGNGNGTSPAANGATPPGLGGLIPGNGNGNNNGNGKGKKS
jgi:hypothetical protein